MPKFIKLTEDEKADDIFLNVSEIVFFQRLHQDQEYPSLVRLSRETFLVRQTPAEILALIEKP